MVIKLVKRSVVLNNKVHIYLYMKLQTFSLSEHHINIYYKSI